MTTIKLILSLLASWAMMLTASAASEDGSRLWLRMEANATEGHVTMKVARTPTTVLAQNELRQFWHGCPVTLLRDKRLGREAFTIKTTGKGIDIASGGDIGLLYGAFHLLRLQQTGADLQMLDVFEHPQYRWRILNHWDNLDGSVERGYAGRSLWQWDELPQKVSDRYKAYARANASVGINTVVLNNVNASPTMLADSVLGKVKVLADIFRPYGLRVCLAVNFASPKVLGHLPTADPLNRDVRNWWKKKADKIYRLIPDFGGFLVKANSEGQPGPSDYARTHADGANMLARVLRPHGGMVMWRAFVYNDTGDDRAKQAYDEFMPLDGKFDDNVILQIKNGPIDFQPREPYSPLFTSLRHTPMMVEFQITQEYLGFSNHLAFLSPMWREFFDQVNPETLKAVAGVANTGRSTNWCGSDFAQANWYAFGRLAWNPELGNEAIAQEWLSQTFTADTAFTHPMTRLMTDSRETVVDYMMPLGLHHLFAWGHHYGPEPWCRQEGARADWLPSYYHKADTQGIGFDRSSTGTRATMQYPDTLAQTYDRLATCPEKYLLWFHHVSWDHRMRDGRTLWEELCHKYDDGVKRVRNMQRTWDRMQRFVDPQRFAAVQRKLRTQARDAVWWKDACLLYFQTFSHKPIPDEVERPVHNLDDMMRFHLDIGNEECPEAGFNK